jgi:uncharacterized membrane protein
MTPGNYVLIGLAILVFLIMMIELRHKILVENSEHRVTDNLNVWKWGIFYFNPADSRIFVPKRIESLGWTLNFARPGSSLLILGFILFVILAKAL